MSNRTSEDRTKVYRLLEPLASEPGLMLAEFDEDVEIRLCSANKADAIQTLLAETDPDVPVAYLGEDVMDERAFSVLNGRGLTVLVRPKYRRTAAQIWLAPQDELTRFFQKWIRACGGSL